MSTCSRCGCAVYVRSGDGWDDDTDLCYDCLRSDNASLTMEVERLQAIVDRLQKDADGLPVVGDEGRLWSRSYYECRLSEPLSVTVRPAYVGSSWCKIGDCHKTREAAEAARE